MNILNIQCFTKSPDFANFIFFRVSDSLLWNYIPLQYGLPCLGVNRFLCSIINVLQISHCVRNDNNCTKNIAAEQGTVAEIYSIADSPKDSYWLNYICSLNV